MNKYRDTKLVIVRTEDKKKPGTTHKHSGCEECLR